MEKGGHDKRRQRPLLHLFLMRDAFFVVPQILICWGDGGRETNTKEVAFLKKSSAKNFCKGVFVTLRVILGFLLRARGKGRAIYRFGNESKLSFPNLRIVLTKNCRFFVPKMTTTRTIS